MSTYSLKSTLRRGTGFFILLLFVWILIAQQLVTPGVTFASSSTSRYQFGKAEVLDKASVSVVRLVVQYASIPAVEGCAKTVMGLGALVGSWSTKPGSADFSNWVLTDGSLLNPNGIPCGGAGKPPEQLSSIQIYLNTAYTSSTSGPVLKSLQCHAISCSDGATTDTITCQILIPIPCEKGTVLLPFHTTAPEPFIDIVPQNQAPPASFGIELTGAFFPPIGADQAAQDLEPVQATTSDPANELGMPIMSSNGQLLDMNTKEVDVGQKIRTFVTAELAPAPVNAQHTNKLRDNWNQGILDFYAQTAHHLVAARNDFTRAGAANAQFRAPAAFLALPQMTALLTPTPSSGTAKSVGARTTPGTQLGPFTVPVAVNAWFSWLLVGTVLLIAIFILIVAMVMRGKTRRKRELAIFEMDRAAAEQKAALEVQRQQAPHAAVYANKPVNPANQNAQPKTDLRCPNCGQTVRAGDKFCSQCRSPLVLSDSGLNVRLETPQKVQNLPPPLPASPPQPQQGLALPGSIFDQPTREMSPSRFENGREDPEKTQLFTMEEETTKNIPAPVERYLGPNISLVVGTRSDPGIKRQHKPNEDSLFAARGERVQHSSMQQFGLFVVADGMGGHANGQDASRLAIQTISEEVLSKVTGNDPLNDDALMQILVNGVQHANQTVHHRNMEQRADMGTTITAALIVGATAYVANVGDSRTYLYRKPGGLRKITNDHSVVASLVEAGIIQPDDIYTHPKRNQIYRSLGEKPVVDVDCFKVALQPEDKLLLCSDGLWDMVRDPAIERILNAVPDPSQTGNALIKAALDGGGEDNVSVIVVQITEATQHTGMAGVQLLARPEEPQWPPL